MLHVGRPPVPCTRGWPEGTVYKDRGGRQSGRNGVSDGRCPGIGITGYLYIWRDQDGWCKFRSGELMVTDIDDFQPNPDFSGRFA